MNNIYLIGYRGAGKSSASKELSKLNKKRAVHLDIEFSKVNGNIESFVKKKGWAEFRKKESAILKKYSLQSDLIVDCGGGIVEDSKNITLMKKTGTVIYLEASKNTIVSRLLKDKNKRPSLNGKSSIDEISEILKKRIPLYENTDFKINTNNNTIKETAAMILQLMSPKVCTVVVEKRVKKAILTLRKIKTLLAEVRLDYIEDIDENNLKKIIDVSRNIIITCRPKKYGGMYCGDERKRLSLLMKAKELGARYIDVEYGTVFSDFDSKTFISIHDFEKTPPLPELERLYDLMNKKNAGLIKIVTSANSINDNFTVFEFLKGKKNLISFCMGEYGVISRILANKFGSKLTYAAFDNKSAPGQISVDELTSLYNYSKINKDTRVIGVIGEHAENSMSKYMHNPNFLDKKINFVYVPFKTDKTALEDFIKNFRKYGFAGASVTVPHKEDIMQYLDEIDATAKKIGAVNTVVNKNGKLIGHNTDYYGAKEALLEKTKLNGKKALLIGAGGAARAITYALKKEGAIVTIINRTQDKAKKLADEFCVSAAEFKDVKKIAAENDIIINSTSVGMNPKPNESILSANEMPQGKIVMDVVYKPCDTLFLQIAKNKKGTIITGDRMLFFQAIGQFEYWTGIYPDTKLMQHELKKRLIK
ncbi:MAG: shikimate dehydrogenase [archaeon]